MTYLFEHGRYLGVGIDGAQGNRWMGIVPNAKHFIGESLADAGDAIEIKNDVAKFFEPRHQAPALGARDQRSIGLIHQLKADHSFGEFNVWLRTEFVEHLAERSMGATHDRECHSRSGVIRLVWEFQPFKSAPLFERDAEAVGFDQEPLTNF